LGRIVGILIRQGLRHDHEADGSDRGRTITSCLRFLGSRPRRSRGFEDFQNGDRAAKDRCGYLFVLDV
jgi:hypothetical protein